MLTRSLQAALQSLPYDFATPLQDSHDDCFYLPATWQIQAPRQFFLNAYSILLKCWVAEFAAAGFSPCLPRIYGTWHDSCQSSPHLGDTRQTALMNNETR